MAPHLKHTLSAAAVLALVSACSTIERARRIQEASVRDGSTNAAAVVSRPVGGVPPPFLDTGRGAPADYVSYALSNRPDVVAAQLSADSALIAVDVAGSGRWPQISGRTGYSRSTGNRKPGGDWRTEGVWAGSVDLDLMICDFGKISAQERAAVENWLAAAEDCADAKLAAAFDVRSCYFDWLRAEAMVAVAQTNEMQYAEHLRQALGRFEVGDVRKLDVTQARLNHSNAGLALLTASNAVSSASAKLMKSMGVSAAFVPASAGIGLDRPPFRLPATDMDARAALDLARTNAPSLRVRRALVRAASARVDYAVADLFPTISVGTGFTFSNPDFPATWNWSFAGNIAGSIFQGFRKKRAVDAAVVDLLAARALLADAEQSLAAEIAIAVADRDTARRALATARLIVREAAENLDVVTEEYRVGEASSIDFLDAVAQHTAALGDRVKAFYVEQTAEAKLARLVGLIPLDVPAESGQSAKEKKSED